MHNRQSDSEVYHPKKVIEALERINGHLMGSSEGDLPRIVKEVQDLIDDINRTGG